MISKDLSSLIESAFEEGENEAKKGIKFPFSWISFFGFKRNPFFTDPITSETATLFTDRVELITKLAKLIGYIAKTDRTYHVALVGAKGTGKTSILNILHAYAEKRYKGVLYNIGSSSSVTNGKNKDLFDTLLTRVTYVFIDDITSSEQATELINMQIEGKTKVIISAWTPEKISKVNIRIDEKIIINPFKNEDLINLLQKRVQWVNGESRIEEDALNLVVKYSKGNPYIFLKMLEDCHKEAYQKKEKIITPTIVEGTVSKLYPVLKLDVSKLTTLEHEICKLLLEKDLNEIDIKELSTRLGIAKPLAWKYLERLKHKGILFKEYEGKKTKYILEKMARIILEMMITKEGDY